ncbi:DUF2946 family protein [Craterilacuibacter sp.]|uniref:DUF2946 family protein n=1 Tax=Craterilacuibacter sp. TaxID=2870909 RepID=UPI003F2AF3E9
MDQQVLAAMAKWPNVPAVYGWLALDARGQWRLKGEVLSQRALLAFFGRNYQCGTDGCWWVQNGPQRVYVALEAAPLVLRRHPGAWQAAPTGEFGAVTALYLTPEGECYAAFAGTLAAVDDRDLALVLDEMLPQWDGEAASLPPGVLCDAVLLPLTLQTHDALLRQFGVCRVPLADAG